MRADMKSLLLSLERDSRRRESSAVIEQILATEEFRNAGTVLAFYPMRSEIDIRPLFDDRFLFPYIDGSDMAFAKAPLEKGLHGFPEPETKIPAEYSKAVMLVPALAFSRNLFRLGRGGGYYDRYIEKNRERLFTIGLSFDENLLERVPCDRFDQMLDLVLSPSSRIAAHPCSQGTA